MRLIDANALEQIITEKFKEHYGNTVYQFIRDFFAFVIRQIRKAPTIEAEPMRHGRWVGLEYDGYADGCPVYDLWECSECGEEVRGEDVPDTHLWCHGCGAKMDVTDINVGNKGGESHETKERGTEVS